MKIYHRSNEILLAACDPDLLGRTFKEGKLNLEVSKDFYDDLRVEKEIFLKNLKLSTIANLVGKVTIGIAIEAGVVDETCIILIDGIPHAQVCTMPDAQNMVL